MLHGPHTKESPCLNDENNKCTKNFPKKFNQFTTFQPNGYPDYRRRDNRLNNFTYSKKKNYNQTINVDNSMVVPYNKYLLLKYNCHINVEYYESIESIKA